MGVIRTILVLACLAAAPASRAEPDLLPLEWPASRTQQELAAYLAGSLRTVHETAARPTLEQRLSAKPFVVDQQRVALDLSSFDAPTAKALKSVAAPAGGGLQLGYRAFVKRAEPLYSERRYFLAKLVYLKNRLGFDTDPGWRHVDVDSLITKTRRRLWFHVKNVLDAALDGLERGRPWVFAPGTWFIAEDMDAHGHVEEVHVLGKRADWDWDFAIYDANGTVSAVSPTQPQMMKVPTTCYTCHRSSGRMPPFRDFPAPSAPVGHVTPKVLVELSAKDAAIVRALTQRPPKADEPLGNYAGLAALALRELAAAPGPKPEWVAPLWKRARAAVPALNE